jgi:NAD(P)-dependent dehydrogenase (short-subunit alcohol dehydrogenase family)
VRKELAGHVDERRFRRRERVVNEAAGDGAASVALVTGANRGIGLEVARQLARRGMMVILGARDQEKGEAAAKGLAAEGLSVLPKQLDVADYLSVDKLAAEVEEDPGRLDVLINNAGIHYDTWQRTLSADLEVVREALETNLLGAWRVCEALVPLMRRGGGGRIINVSSGAGSLSEMGADTPAYGVSKAALNALTVKLAAELRSADILVNSVCPGWVATDMGGSGGRPVEDGAAGVVWAATLEGDGPSGGFFRDGRPIEW